MGKVVMCGEFCRDAVVASWRVELVGVFSGDVVLSALFSGDGWVGRGGLCNSGGGTLLLPLRL